MTRQFDTLPAFPGSTDESVKVLVEMLDIVITAKTPPQDFLLNWIKQTYLVQRKTAVNAIQGLSRSGLIATRRGGAVDLTDLGMRVHQVGVTGCHRLLVPHFLTIYSGFSETLEVLSNANKALSVSEIAELRGANYSRWKVGEQVHWLVALQCADYADSGVLFRITPVGKTLLADWMDNTATPIEESGQQPTGTRATLLSLFQRKALGEELIREVGIASIASADYVRLETALVRIFTFLGYSADPAGGSGDTDVLVKIQLGAASYSVVVDAKSHLAHRRADVEPDNIAQHRRKHKATYAMVIAKRFAQGRRIEEAKTQQVVFMTTECLSAWIRIHAETQLSPVAYETIFQQGGLLDELPHEIKTRANRVNRLLNLITEIFAIFTEAHRVKLSMNIPIDHLLKTANERHKDKPYQIDDLREVISFLKSPFLGCLGEDKEGGLFLERNPGDLPCVLATMIQGLQAASNET